MQLIISLLLITTLSATRVTITGLDENQVQGTLATWNDDAIQLTGSGSAKVALGNLLRVEVETSSAGREADSSVRVELVDGSEWSAGNFLSVGEAAELQPVGDDMPHVEVQTSAVRSVRLAQFNDEPLPSDVHDELNAQWREILNQTLNADAIVIFKRDAMSLDYVAGVLGDVDDENVQFTLDGQQLSVSRAKVYGIVFYRDKKPRRAASSNAVVQGDAFRVLAKTVDWNDDEFIVTNALLGRVQLPAVAVSSIDFSAGKLAYLSDLEPTEFDWQPATPHLALSPLLAGLSRDRGFYSSVIEVEYPASALSPERSTSAGLSNVQQFRKGLSARCGVKVTYEIPGGYQWFRATAALDPRTEPTVDVEVELLIDGQSRVKEVLTPRGAPIELKCNIEGATELSIVVDRLTTSGSKHRFLLGAGDIVNLGGARITQ